MVYRIKDEDLSSAPTQCQRMLRGMEAIVKRVESLEKHNLRSRWLSVTLFVFLVCVTIYNVFDDLRIHPLFASSLSHKEAIAARKYVYDDQGRLEAHLKFNLKNELIWKRVFQYDENGNNIVRQDFNKDGVAIYHIESSFDDAGNEIERVETNLVKGQSEKWVFTYNEKGAKVRAQKNEIESPSTG